MSKKKSRGKRAYLSSFNLGALVILASSLVLSSLVLIGMLLFGGSVTFPTNTRDDSPPSAEPQTRTDSLVLGAFVPGSTNYSSSIDSFADKVGRQPAIVMWFQAWEGNAEFDPTRMNATAERNAMPMVTWQPWNASKGVSQPEYALRNIASGKHDVYIRQWAKDAAAWDKPFYLRFAHEMNIDGFPWGVGVNGNTSDQYVAAWRHVHDIFQQEGATNVRWVWSPNVVSGNSTPFSWVYPGDDYVDWVALDGYNRGTIRSWSNWRSLADIFGHSHDALTKMTNKPMMIAEVGSAEVGGDKAVWIRQGLLQEVPSRLPQVRAVIWFDIDKEADWRVNSSPEALAAFREVALSSQYQGQLP